MFVVVCHLWTYSYKKNQEYFNEECHPASTWCTLWEWDPCGFLPFFFSPSISFIKAVMEYLLKAKRVWVLIKVLGLVFTTSAFIKATSSEAFLGDTYVLMNNILHFMSQIMVELYFLISRFYLNSIFYCWCSASKAEFVILYFYVMGCLLLYSHI